MSNYSILWKVNKSEYQLPVSIFYHSNKPFLTDLGDGWVASQWACPCGYVHLESLWSFIHVFEALVWWLEDWDLPCHMAPSPLVDWPIFLYMACKSHECESRSVKASWGLDSGVPTTSCQSQQIAKPARFKAEKYYLPLTGHVSVILQRVRT